MGNKIQRKVVFSTSNIFAVHANVVFGLGMNLLLKSILGHCGYSKVSIKSPVLLKDLV